MSDMMIGMCLIAKYWLICQYDYLDACIRSLIYFIVRSINQILCNVEMNIDKQSKCECFVLIAQQGSYQEGSDGEQLRFNDQRPKLKFRNSWRKKVLFTNYKNSILQTQLLQSIIIMEFQVQKLLQKQATFAQFDTPKRILQIRQIVGRIYVLWKDNQGRPIHKQHGTAFAISDSIILTCLHNTYLPKHTAYCSQVLFQFGVKKGNMENYNIYKSQNKHFLYCRQPQRSMSQKPLKQQLCLIVLQQKLPIDSFIQIQNSDLQEIRMDQKIGIVGYSCNNCSMGQSQFVKTQQQGSIHSIDQHIINHTIATSPGESGSPIFQQDKQGNMKIIGMHTHRGVLEQFNSGLCFNNDMIQILASLLRQIIDSQHQEQEIVSQAMQSLRKLKRKLVNGGDRLLSSGISVDGQDKGHNKWDQSTISSQSSMDEKIQQNSEDQSFDKFRFEIGGSFLQNIKEYCGIKLPEKNQLLDQRPEIQNEREVEECQEIIIEISYNGRSLCVKKQTELTNVNKEFDETYQGDPYVQSFPY